MSIDSPELRTEPLSKSFMSIGEFAQRVLLFGALVVGALALWQLRLVLLMTFLAIIVAISLDIPVRRLQRYGLRRGLAMMIVSVVSLLVLIILITAIGAPLVIQTQNLVEDLPGALETLREDYSKLAEDSPILPTFESVNDFGTDNEGTTSSLVSTDTLTGGALLVTSVGSFVVSLAVNLLLVIIVSMYLLADPETYANSLLALTPKHRQSLILQILVDLRQALVNWLVSQLIAMTITGVLIWFTLGIIWGVPNAIALGMLAGVLTFIPNFGSVMSAIPGVIFTLAERPGYVLPVLITYIVVQQIESNLITPTIIKRRLQIPAAALLVFQVMASVLFGFMGLLLAVPLFMVILVLVRDLYVDYLLDNINTSIESRESEDGETVLRVTSSKHSTREIPLRQIFKGSGPFDHSLQEVMQTIARQEQEISADLEDDI